MKPYLQKHSKIKYTDNWSTPPEIYNYYKKLGYIDPCPLNCLTNNLDKDYKGLNLFINPPYSDIKNWVEFCINNHYNNHIVLLVPSRTDVKWFHKLLNYGVDLEFIKGRLKFGGLKTGAPFPSVLIHLNKKEE